MKRLLSLLLIALCFAAGHAGAQEPSFDVAPMPLKMPPPDYPESLKNDRITGMVAVSILIDESGNVSLPKIEKSAHPDFEKPAIAAVALWKFRPAKKAGQPVAVRIVMPVRFVAP